MLNHENEIFVVDWSYRHYLERKSEEFVSFAAIDIDSVEDAQFFAVSQSFLIFLFLNARENDCIVVKPEEGAFSAAVCKVLVLHWGRICSVDILQSVQGG